MNTSQVYYYFFWCYYFSPDGSRQAQPWRTRASQRRAAYRNFILSHAKGKSLDDSLFPVLRISVFVQKCFTMSLEQDLLRVSFVSKAFFAFAFHDDIWCAIIISSDRWLIFPFTSPSQLRPQARTRPARARRNVRMAREVSSLWTLSLPLQPSSQMRLEWMSTISLSAGAGHTDEQWWVIRIYHLKMPPQSTRGLSATCSTTPGCVRYYLKSNYPQSSQQNLPSRLN